MQRPQTDRRKITNGSHVDPDNKITSKSHAAHE